MLFFPPPLYEKTSTKLTLKLHLSLSLTLFLSPDEPILRIRQTEKDIPQPEGGVGEAIAIFGSRLCSDNLHGRAHIRTQNTQPASCAQADLGASKHGIWQKLCRACQDCQKEHAALQKGYAWLRVQRWLRYHPAYIMPAQLAPGTRIHSLGDLCSSSLNAEAVELHCQLHPTLLG